MTETTLEKGSIASDPSTLTKRPRYKNTIHLWEFLIELLADEKYSSIIAWSRKDFGEFKLKNQEEVAKTWGRIKHREGMNYEKLSRAIRYYYHQGIIQKVPGQRLVYKFGQLPYEYKPRTKRPAKIELEKQEKTSNRPALVPLKQLKPKAPQITTQALLPLTSLTPPPQIGFQFPNLVTSLPACCGCAVDYCSMRTICCAHHFAGFPGNPLMYHSNGQYALNMIDNSLPSPPRSIRVPVIKSTQTN